MQSERERYHQPNTGPEGKTPGDSPTTFCFSPAQHETPVVYLDINTGSQIKAAD